jgi:hypothetical protein
MFFKKKLLALALIMSTTMAVCAQGVDKIKTTVDGTRTLTTTQVRYAKGGGLFGKSRHMAMSHITHPDGKQTWAIVMPINSRDRHIIGTGRRMVLHLQDGTSIKLPNLNNIGKVENHEEFDHTYTILPAYAVNEEQLDELTQQQVISIALETDEGVITIDNRDYRREWSFNRMLQRCHNVLKWKLAEFDNVN